MTNKKSERFDVCIVGAGMAGLSLAAQLAPHRRIVLLEAETQVGFHATGRSAALFTTTYGGRVVRELTSASENFLRTPPEGFTDVPLLTPRHCMYVAPADRARALAAFAEEVAPQCPNIIFAPSAAAASGWPLVEEFAAQAVVDPSAADIDVHAMTTGFLRLARASGAVVRLNSRLLSAARKNGIWQLETSSGEICCDQVVNAGGAWADEIAVSLGARPLGLQPRRRTVVCVEAPVAGIPDDGPFVVNMDMSLYFKPDTGRLLISPADESASSACDAQPDELDVAIAIDRFENATGFVIKRIVSCWAGLRTFAADEKPVVGFDADVPGLFWLAGQGGFGIQTAPALARLGAALLLGEVVPAELTSRGVHSEDVAPRRLPAEPAPRIG